MTYHRTVAAVLTSLLLFAAGCSNSGPAAERKESLTAQNGQPAAVQRPACTLDSAADKEVAAWLSANGLPLKSLSAGADFDDLAPLKEILRDVRVVALGQQTYGSSEFYTAKHRLVQFLVKEMGFALIGFEGNYATSVEANEYLIEGQWTPGDAVRSLHMWPWRTEEIREMFQWLRAENQQRSPEQMVRLYGYAHTSTSRSSQMVQSFLKQHAPEWMEKLDANWSTYAVNVPAAGTADRNAAAAQLRAMEELIAFLQAEEEALAGKSSPAKVREIQSYARSLYRYQDTYFNTANMEEVLEKANRYSFETAMEILESFGPESRMIVWGHNEYLHTSGMTQGALFRQALGDRYYALGFAFDYGGFYGINEDAQPRGFADMTADPAPAGSTEWFLACAGEGARLFDFRQSGKSAAAAAWLAQPRPFRRIGSVYSPSSASTAFKPVLPGAFDGLLFIPQTTPSRPFR